jgi:hypothetical protein
VIISLTGLDLQVERVALGWLVELVLPVEPVLVVVVLQLEQHFVLRQL